MSLSHALEAFAGRRLQRGLTRLHPLRHRYHARHLQAGQIDPATRRQAQATWWGDEPRWYPGGTPPRRHNQVTPLLHGATYFPALQQALTQAEHYVYIAGWCLTPHIPLARHTETALIETRLLALLRQTAQRVPVRLLLWGGAPALLQPTTRAMRAVVRAIEAGAAGCDLQVALDHAAGHTHCLHQKAIVIDGQLAFVGGMDLTTFQGDRWDTAEHPLRAGPNWHDVQAQVQGEAVADVEQNFRQRWQAVTGRADLPHRDPVLDPRWQTPVQVVRTIPHHAYPFAPQGEFGIHHAYVETIKRAQHLIYLENQYLWSPEIMDALQTALAAPHDGPFRIVVVLPARAYSGKWDNDKHVTELRQADRGRGQVAVYCPYASGPSHGPRAFAYRPIYVHAKVGLIDDEWGLIGSANLNDRGMITDGELDVLVHEPALVRTIRVALWAEHLGMAPEAVAQTAPHELIDGAWAQQAATNGEILRRGEEPLVGTILRYETGRMPGSWLLEEAELLTLEH